jgi:diguanylate cyclase (GGDEF)-like protein
MPIRRVLAFALTCAIALPLCAGDTRVASLLDEAERIHAADKARSKRLLGDAERALANDPALTARARLLECKWADDAPAALRAADAGLAAASRAGSIALRAKLTACRGTALVAAERNSDAERDLTAAAALARQSGDSQTETEVLSTLGYLQYTRGAMADALANVQSAYRIAERIHYEKSRLEALSLIANVYADANVAQYDRAIEYYRQLAAAYEARGQMSDVADTVFNIGSTYEAKGDFAAAERQYRRALVLFQKLGSAKDVAFTRRALASALMKSGRASEALPLADASVAYYERTHDAESFAMARQIRGMVYRRLGRAADALRDLDAARGYFEAQKNTRFLEKNAAEAALVYAAGGDWREAYEAERRHAALQQQLAESRRDEASSRLRVEFDAEKTEQENRSLARENALRAAALREANRNARLQVVVIALTALLAAALALLFWRQVANTRRMRAMALTDELTRLPNRRHILAAVDIAFAAAKHDRLPTALVTFDIDHFKRVNDTYGHAAGDTVLQNVARACRLELRGGDHLGRVGGEEFLAVLQVTTARQALDVAERLRAAVERLDFSAIDPSLHVTISLGVRVAREYDPRAAIAAADALLYRAKERGRNCVEADLAPDAATRVASAAAADALTPGAANQR